MIVCSRSVLQGVDANTSEDWRAMRWNVSAMKAFRTCMAFPEILPENPRAFQTLRMYDAYVSSFLRLGATCGFFSAMVFNVFDFTQEKKIENIVNPRIRHDSCFIAFFWQEIGLQ